MRNILLVVYIVLCVAAAGSSAYGKGPADAQKDRALPVPSPEQHNKKAAGKSGAGAEKKTEVKSADIEKAGGPEAEAKIDSPFNKYHTTGPYQDISVELEPFGYKFFSESYAASLTPRMDIPVSPDYIIGPGDEVKVFFWGRIDEEHSLIVSKEGSITIPKIGPLDVAGMSFREMKKYLKKQTQQIIGADINISMGELKSIHVFVLGEVQRPGSYSIDAFSTIVSAILVAGGPTDIGSLRGIQLKRNNEVLVTMDFYDFLLKGDKTQDRNLKSGDVVFIPTVGPLVGVAGNVKRPAIYEMKNEYDLMSLFNMAGGVTPGAYTQQIQIKRIQKNENQIIVDIDDKDLKEAGEFVLQDGDLVKVFSIVDKDVNVVFLEGNVKRPGKYEYKPGMRIRDLIKGTTDLLQETYFEYAFIKRQKLPLLETELIPFSPGKLLLEEDDASNIELEPQDSIYIFSKWVFKGRPNIKVEGEVRRRGKYKLLDNYRVKDAILDAGGLGQDASIQKGEIFRFDEQGDVEQIYFNVGRAMKGNIKENILLQNRDKIVIHSIWENKYKYTVSISGEIKNPGKYPLAKGMRISDLVFAAGNLLEAAYMEEAELSCYTSSNGKKLNIQKINLGLALENDPEHDLELGSYDRVIVRRMPNWQEEMMVRLSGEVRFPGVYPIEKGAKLSSLIERAGGYTDNAYLRGALFVRVRVKEMQQKGLDEMVLRLEREILYDSSKQVSKARTDDEVESRNSELYQKQKFIASLKKLDATGRLSMKLADLDALRGSEYDIELEAGDTLDIPMKNSVVDIVGAVMSRGSFVFTDRFGYKDYIGMAGGFTRYADEENVYVMKVDGSARKLSRNSFSWKTSGTILETDTFGGIIKEIEPGDTIVVPEEIEHIAWLRDFKDVSTILYQIAIATGVTLVLF